MSKLAKLAHLSVALVAAISLVPEKGHTQAAAAVAPASQAAIQQAAQVRAAVASVSSAVQATAAGAAFSKFVSGPVLNDLEESLKNHPDFAPTVQSVLKTVSTKKNELSATQAEALAAVLELAASLKNSVSFQAAGGQLRPYNKADLDQALAQAPLRGISLAKEELEAVAMSFYSLLTGTELLSLIEQDKLDDKSLGYRLLEAFNKEGTGRSAEEVLAQQVSALNAVKGDRTVAQIAEGLKSCANFQPVNVGR